MTAEKIQSIILKREAFIDAVPERGALLGIDVGSKYLGIAVSNASKSLAHPRAAILRKGWKADKMVLENLLKDTLAVGFVLGEPMTLRGEHGQAVDKVLSFADLLKQAFPELPITLWDERLTTVAAEKELFLARQGRQTRMSKKESKKFVDSAAAVLILQGFLDFYSGEIYKG